MQGSIRRGHRTPIEGLLSRLRAGEVVFSDLAAEAILLATDRLELATDALLTNRPLEGLRLLPLVQGLEKMSRAMPEGDRCRRIGADRIGNRFQAAASSALPKGKSLSGSRKNLQVADDLRFFRAIALQSEARSPFRRVGPTVSCGWHSKRIRRVERRSIRSSSKPPSIFTTLA